jgi:hypothetical protein
MKKLYQLLGNRHPTQGDVGIEIEVEGQDLVPVNNKWWKTEDDGSLRGRFPDEKAEYVLNQPILRKDVRPVLKVLAKALENSKLNFSFRTSVHVHVNCTDLSMTQIYNVIYTYLLLEEPLVSFCGKERKGNRFCLRLQDAEGLLDTLTKMFQLGDRGIDLIRQDAIRYASINIGSLLKYGSLEFRAMRGNLDVDVLKTWTEALMRVRDFGANAKSPKEVYEMYSNLGPEGFFSEVLGNLSEHFRYPRMVKEIQRSFSLSLDLPYSYKEVKEEKNALKINMDYGLGANPAPPLVVDWGQAMEMAARHADARNIPAAPRVRNRPAFRPILDEAI